MTDLGTEYGGALFELAAEEGRDGEIHLQLKQAVELFRQQPDYLKLLCTPSVPKRERCGLLEQALGGRMDRYLVNFLQLLCGRGALRQLPGCLSEYTRRYNQAHGILPARAVSAVALSPQQEQQLKTRLESLTGKQVELTVSVDRSLVGGLRLEMDGVSLDGTVKGRLDRLRRELENTVL